MTRTKYYSLLVGRFAEVSDLSQKHFGYGAQKIKAIEEMGELIRALAKDLNDSNIKSHEVMDEIADVLIMVNQLRLFYDPEWIDERMLFKLHRTEVFMKKQITEPIPPSLL